MTALTQDGVTGVLGTMKYYALIMLGVLTCAVTPANAAGDVDLLSFDPVPQKKISDAPPVEVIPHQSKVEPSKPVAAEPPLKAAPPKAQPPVEVAPPKFVKAPVAKRPVAAPPKVAAKISPPVAPSVKPPKPIAPVIIEAAKPPAPETLKPEPAPVVVAPALDAAITPLPPEALHDQKLAKKVILRKAETPPAAPESFVKLKEPAIQAGDPLRIEVVGEGELSGWYKVMPDGTITLPMIGKVRAQGFTPAKLAEILTATLKDGYLVNPQVSVTGKAKP